MSDHDYLAQAIRQSGLHKTDRLVLLAINLLNAQDSDDYSDARLAEATGYAETTVRLSLHRLIKARILDGDGTQMYNSDIDLFYLPPRKGKKA